MLFKAKVLERIGRGEVTLAFRRWAKPTVRAGGTLRTAAGVLAIDSIEPADVEAVSEADIRAAGYASREAFMGDLRVEGDLYRIAFHISGADPTQTGSQLATGKAARLWTHIWLLIKACGARPTKPFSFPFSHSLHLSLQAGPRSSINDLTFNPNFSDWLMGWPIGWTDPTRPVMEWSAWLRRMRGELSRLPT